MDEQIEDKTLNDIIQWDVKSWSKALHYWDKEVDWSEIKNALELGGRSGGLSLWLALKGIPVICSDLNDVKEKAFPLHSKYKVLEAVTYEDLDATELSYSNHFDLIVFKSIIGGIGYNNNKANQQLAFGQIYKALKPGGILLFAENLSASFLHRTLRKYFVNWGASWRYLSLPEMREMLDVFSNYEIRTNGVLATFGRSEKQRSMLSKIDRLLLDRICPKSWKYIAYGYAVK